jgi:autotransporter-associated beta strand protein
VTLLVSATPSAYAQRVLGLDISAHQGNISQTTWNNIHNVENRDFVIIRASRGGTTGQDNRQGGSFPAPGNTAYRLSQRYDDPYFIQNINRATTAGMFAGTYHRSRADVLASTPNSSHFGGTAGVDNSGTDDANHFIQMAGPFMRPGYLPPVLDFEDGELEHTDQQMAQFALDFGNRIYEVMKIRAAIYVNGNYAQNILGGGTAAQRAELAQQTAVQPSFLSPTFPTLWSARWPNQADPNSIDVQNLNPTVGFSNIYGPWDDYGVTHPWTIWQYASTGRLQSFNNGNNNLDFNVAHGDIEYLKNQLIPAVWWNDTNGDWSTLVNWNSGQPVVTPPFPLAGNITPAAVGPLPTPRLPGAAGAGPTSGQHDTVILERPNANITVTVSTGTHNIRKLYMRESLDITGGTLSVSYDPTYRPDNSPAIHGGPISAQFSGPVTLGGGTLNVHTLQVDSTRTLTLSGGTLAINKLNLMPHASTPARILLGGDVNINPLNNAAASIANGAGPGSSGRVDLGGAARAIAVADGTAAVDLTISVPVINGGLTKAGSGTLALTGANTYAGDTSVLAGTLRFTAANLANAADVALAAGANLDLAFSAATPDVIDSLLIGGVSMPAGTWGAVGSAAAFQTPQITGTGILEVTTFTPSADFNSDGRVDDADLAAWRLGFGAVGSPELSFDIFRALGDANFDRAVDSTDLFVWQQQYDPVPPAAAVPEPAAAALAAAALLALALHARRSLAV